MFLYHYATAPLSTACILIYLAGKVIQRCKIDPPDSKKEGEIMNPKETCFVLQNTFSSLGAYRARSTSSILDKSPCSWRIYYMWREYHFLGKNSNYHLIFGNTGRKMPPVMWCSCLMSQFDLFFSPHQTRLFLYQCACFVMLW